MKRIIIFALLASLGVLINYSCSLIKKASSNNTGYKIKHIDNNDFVYIIDAVRNNTVFRIISIKGTDNTIRENIKIGDSYHLELLQVYPSMESIKANTSKINFNDSCFISLDKRTRYNLYIARNLNGLSLTDTVKSIAEIVDNINIYAMYCDACKKRNNVLIRLFVK